MVDVKNDNVQKTCYTEHESICKSTHGSIVKVLCEGNPLEQIYNNSCSRQGVENTLSLTGNANIVNSSVRTILSVMQPSHRKRKRRVSLGNKGILSTVQKTLVRGVRMGLKFGQASKSADKDVNFLSIIPSVSIKTNAATAVGSMKTKVQIDNNAATAVVSIFQCKPNKVKVVLSVEKRRSEAVAVWKPTVQSKEYGDVKELY